MASRIYGGQRALFLIEQPQGGEWAHKGVSHAKEWRPHRPQRPRKIPGAPEVQAGNIESSRSARDHSSRPEPERKGFTNGRRQVLSVNSGNELMVKVDDPEVELWIFEIPGDVVDPIWPRVLARAGDDFLEILETSPMKKQTDMEIELLRTRKTLVEATDLVEMGPFVKWPLRVDVVSNKVGQGIGARPLDMTRRGDDPFKVVITEIEISEHGVCLAVDENLKPTVHRVR